MAIVSFGPLVTGARGSIGGCTFSMAGSGATVRARPRPPKPRKALQTASQSHIAAASALWTALATVSKVAWTLYAGTITLYDSLARAYSPSGRQCFMWSYCVQMSGGLTPDMSIPAGAGLASIPTLTLTYTTPALTLTAWAPTPNAASQFVFKVFNADVPRAFNRRPLLGTVECLGNEGLPFTLAADVNGSWADALDLRVWISVRMLDEDLKLSTRLWQYKDFTSDV